MVLHNDKWKYKAKRDYQRKHGLGKDGKPLEGGAERVFKEGTRKGATEEEEEVELEGVLDSQSEEELTEEEQLARERELLGNSWRFLDPEQSQDLLRDPEYVAKLEQEQALEREMAAHHANIVNSKLQEHSQATEEDLQRQYAVQGRLVSARKLKDEELLRLRIAGSDDEEEATPEPQTRTFSPEEQEKFLRLQKMIDHRKRIEEMKRIVGKHRPGVGNVRDVYTSKESDNYSFLVDKHLRDAVITQSTHNFDSLVDDLLGVDLSDDKSTQKQPANAKFDLDALLTTSAPAPKQKSAALPPLKLNDDFLDSIL